MYLLSGCKYSTEIFKRAFWYDGEILECGTPRNDLFLNDMQRLRKKYYDKVKYYRSIEKWFFMLQLLEKIIIWMSIMSITQRRCKR